MIKYWRKGSRQPLLLVLALILSACAIPPSADAKVTNVYEHGFAKEVKISGTDMKVVNMTDTFTQDDEFVYAYTRASFTLTNFTWRWYDPSGPVYSSGSEKWTCGLPKCGFYYRIPIRDNDAASKLGNWRMELLADGTILYTDSFKLLAVVNEELEWVFDVNSHMGAHVALTVTIHPSFEKWSDYWFLIGEQVSNFGAHEHGTNKTLGVMTSKEDSQTKVTVVFDSPQGDGYKFTISFDLASAFGSMGSDLFLRWSWSSGIHPVPQSVTVILPSGFKLVRMQELSTNYSRSVEMGREIVSFEGTAPPNGDLQWTVVYGETPKTATTVVSSTTAVSVAASSGQLGWPVLIVAALAIILVVGLVVFFRRRGHRVPAELPAKAPPVSSPT